MSLFRQLTDVGRHNITVAFWGLPPWQMRSAWLFDNVGMCVSSVPLYEQLLLVRALGSARGCPGSTCIGLSGWKGVILSHSLSPLPMVVARPRLWTLGFGRKQ